MTKRKILQKKTCRDKKSVLKCQNPKQENPNQVRMTSKLRSKLKNLVCVGQDLWRVFNRSGDAYYCKDPILLADTVYRRKYSEVNIQNLNGQYIKQYLITGKKDKTENKGVI
jgi:hypothetical protein